MHERRIRNSTKHAFGYAAFVLALLITSISGGRLFPAGGVVTAQGTQRVQFDVRAGFDGYYRPDSWVPVHIVVENVGQPIDGQIQVTATGNWRDVTYTQPAVLPTQSRKQFTLYTHVYQGSRELTIRLLEAQRTLAQQKVRLQPLTNQDFLYAVVSQDLSLNYLAGLPPPAGHRVYVAHISLADLPTQGRVLTSVDMLILHDAESSRMGDRQRDALRGWVAMGGHLLICGGPNAIITAAGLGDLNPVQILGTETTADVSELGEYARAPFIANVPAVVARVQPVAENARVLAGAPGLPLLVRRELDSGRIDYLTLDPELEPMRNWIGNNNFWSKLAFHVPLGERIKQSLGGRWLEGTITNIPSLDIPSVFLVVGFLLAYVVIVGPLNFLVLKLIDRRALAWITVPVLILLFSCVVYAVGATLRGRQVIVSEITFLRAQLESQTARIDSYVGLYSPNRRARDIRLADNALIHRLPNPYVLGSVGSDQLTVEQGPPTYLRKLAIDVGAVRTFSMRTVQPWSGLEVDLDVSPTSGNAVHIEGTIVNRSESDVTGCAVLLGQRYVRLPDLVAGETQTIAVDLQSGKPVMRNTIVNNLVGKRPFTGQGSREQERKHDTLHHALSTVADEQPTLIGWIEKSPVRITVVDSTSTAHTTALLLAPLPGPRGK